MTQSRVYLIIQQKILETHKKYNNTTKKCKYDKTYSLRPQRIVSGEWDPPHKSDKSFQNWKVHILVGRTKKKRVHILRGRREYHLYVRSNVM